MGRYARIVGWGKYLPQRIVTNKELEKRINTSDSWIRSRTGIGQRHVAADSETASSMATAAGRRALEVAALPPSSLDLVIAATCTADRIFPACASMVQHALGASRAAAFDVNAACSGFIHALTTAWQFLKAGSYNTALVVGSEVYSRILNWDDRSTCVLFGDGAGAVVLQAYDSPPGLLSFVLANDGSAADILYVPGPCGPPTNSQDGHYYLAMNGPEVYKCAVNAMCSAAREAVAAAGLDISHIELLIPHQANRRIIETTARRLGLPPDKVFLNVEQYGNTSAASIPIALCEAAEQGRLQKGDHLVLTGIGGGLAWGALVLEWGTDPDVG